MANFWFVHSQENASAPMTMTCLVSGTCSFSVRAPAVRVKIAPGANEQSTLDSFPFTKRGGADTGSVLVSSLIVVLSGALTGVSVEASSEGPLRVALAFSGGAAGDSWLTRTLPLIITVAPDARALVIFCACSNMSVACAARAGLRAFCRNWKSGNAASGFWLFRYIWARL